MKTISHQNTTWLQVQKPKEKDLKKLKEKFGFHSITLQELKKPSVRAKVERYKDYIFMVVHFPIYNKKEKTVVRGEIDFLINKNTLALTIIHYRKIQALEEVLEHFKQDEQLKKKYFKDPVKLLYYILSANYKFSLRQLEHVRKNIDQVEGDIYKNKEKEMLKEIAYLLRNITNFKRIMKFHENILNSLRKEIIKLFGRKYNPYLANLEGQFRNVDNVLENHVETIKILYDTNQSLFTAKTNEAIKVLTVIAVFTFPLTLLATIFAWDTRVLPIVGMPHDFWILVTSFVVIALSMYAIFKHMKWI
jgi:magnesium transporter